MIFVISDTKLKTITKTKLIHYNKYINKYYNLNNNNKNQYKYLKRYKYIYLIT